MDGTEHEALSKAAGHFPGTGALGEGNYCIAGHNSTIYAEIFNEMKHIEIGMGYISMTIILAEQSMPTQLQKIYRESSETWGTSIVKDFFEYYVKIAKNALKILTGMVENVIIIKEKVAFLPESIILRIIK